MWHNANPNANPGEPLATAFGATLSATLMNRLALGILLTTLAFALGYVGVVVVYQQGIPVQRVEVRGAYQTQTIAGVRGAVAQLHGSFLSLDMMAVKREFELMPWVYRAQAQRVWPGRIRVTLEERLPLAAWNDRDTLSVRGEVYPAKPAPELPQVEAPDGMEGVVARRYAEFSTILAPKGWTITRARLDRRSAWRLILNDGLVIDLGQEQLSARLHRFVRFYAAATRVAGSIAYVDMRYPNGFAIRLGSPSIKRPETLS